MADYTRLSRETGVPLVSVIVSCEAQINSVRLRDRATDIPSGSSKLSDVSILEDIRREEDIYKFGREKCDEEIELDATCLVPKESAQMIFATATNVEKRL